MSVFVLVQSVSLDDMSEEVKEAMGSSIEPDIIVSVERVRVDQSFTSYSNPCPTLNLTFASTLRPALTS